MLISWFMEKCGRKSRDNGGFFKHFIRSRKIITLDFFVFCRIITLDFFDF